LPGGPLREISCRPTFPNLRVARAVVTPTSKGRILRHYGMTASTTNALSVLAWRHQPRGTTPRTAQKSHSHLFGTPMLAKKDSARCRPASSSLPSSTHTSAGSSKDRAGERLALCPVNVVAPGQRWRPIRRTLQQETPQVERGFERYGLLTSVNNSPLLPIHFNTSTRAPA
jgi:hypothetical protein